MSGRRRTEFLHLCQVVEDRDLRIGLATTQVIGCFQLSVTDGKGRDLAVRSSLLGGLDDAADLILDQLGAKAKDQRRG